MAGLFLIIALMFSGRPASGEFKTSKGTRNKHHDITCVRGVCFIKLVISLKKLKRMSHDQDSLP